MQYIPPDTATAACKTIWRPRHSPARRSPGPKRARLAACARSGAPECPPHCIPNGWPSRSACTARRRDTERAPSDRRFRRRSNTPRLQLRCGGRKGVLSPSHADGEPSMRRCTLPLVHLSSVTRQQQQQQQQQRSRSSGAAAACAAAAAASCGVKQQQHAAAPAVDCYASLFHYAQP